MLKMEIKLKVKSSKLHVNPENPNNLFNIYLSFYKTHNIFILIKHLISNLLQTNKSRKIAFRQNSWGMNVAQELVKFKRYYMLDLFYLYIIILFLFH